MKRLEVIECITCHKPALKKAFAQKYCPPCSHIADLKRKTAWAKKNYVYDPSNQAKMNVARREATGEKMSVSDDKRSSIVRIERPDFYRCQTIAIPFNSALLKNHAWSLNRKYGHIFLRDETRKAQEDLVQRLTPIPPDRWKNNKVWIDIFVQKPDQRSGDAINMVDRVCDAIKKAIDVDDRWFCIRSVDWEIVKKDPLIYIGVMQENVEDARVCSICGLILGFAKFMKCKSNKFGIGRECVDCVSHIRKKLRKLPPAA